MSVDWLDEIQENNIWETENEQKKGRRSANDCKHLPYLSKQC